MAKVPFELHVSLYQWEDVSVHWNVYVRHYSRDEFREADVAVLLDPADIELSVNALLDSLAWAGEHQRMSTIRLRTPATQPEGPAQLSFSPASGDADAEIRRSESGPWTTRSE